MEQLANNASTTLNGSVNNSVTSVVVTDGSVFPSSGNYRIAVEGELMLVTARAGNTLTVTRGIETTTASGHASGAIAALLYTKGSFEQIIKEYQQVGPWASRPSAPRKGTFYTANDLGARWWFNGTGWDLIYPTYVPVARQWDPTGWTGQNQGTGVFSNRNGILDIKSNSNTQSIRGYSKPVLTPPYAVNWLIGSIPWTQQASGMYCGFRDSGSGKIKIIFTTGMQGGIHGVENWNTFNSFNGTPSGAQLSTTRGLTWIKIEDDNTNWLFSVSKDGMFYTTIHSVARNDFATAADQIFFGGFTSVDLNPTVITSPNLTLYAYWEG